MSAYKYPFLVPNPVRLSEHVDQLRRIEASGWFSNYGPTNIEFETDVIRSLYAGSGHCVTVNNATIGLMLAIKHACEMRQTRSTVVTRRAKYAIMPAFTFPATGHAALWNGLTPLLCDVDPNTWLPDTQSILSLVTTYDDQVAVVVPNATFGNPLDVTWYEHLTEQTGIPVVVDAAASMGSYTHDGRHFGHGSSIPIVFSFHATKTFATAEGGLIYSAHADTIRELRRMGNFGFDEHRSTVLPGLNSKLSEIGALLCLEKLHEFPQVLQKRRRLAQLYATTLVPDLVTQYVSPNSPPFQFYPVAVRVNAATPGCRDRLVQSAAANGLEVRTYFSPLLHQHPYFSKRSLCDNLDHSLSLAERTLSVPLHDHLSEEDVRVISEIVNRSFESSINVTRTGTHGTT